MELYNISKVQIKEEPRLPVNDFRRRAPKEKTVKQSTIHFAPVRKALLKIAALW